MTRTKRLATMVSLAAAPELGVVGNCTTDRSCCTAVAGPCNSALVVLALAEVGRKTGHMRWGSTGLCLACRSKHPGTDYRYSWDRGSLRSWPAR